MAPTLLILDVYCALIVAASLVGGRLPSLVRLTHKRMQLLISFVGGLMLGIAVFHMLPHALAALGPAQIDQAVACLMLGLLVMFFLLRAFHFHQHEPAPPELAGDEREHDCGHDHDHGHDHAGHEHHAPLAGQLSWAGVFIGLSVHTLIDGLALGASLQADAGHARRGWMLGLGTFLAILLHKPLDALSITTLMRAAHWPTGWQMLVNAAFAAMCPLGACLFLLGAHYLPEQQSLIVGSMLAFSAGVFLCISLSDLLPEMEFHSHHRMPLSIALLAGIALAWGIRWLEPPGAHAPPREQAVNWRPAR
jgi:zinc and cadmium transporter